MSAFGQPGPALHLALSPDATRAAGRDAVQNARSDIWLLDFVRGVPTRLTFRQSRGSYPVWSPDGARIILAAGDQAPDTILRESRERRG